MELEFGVDRRDGTLVTRVLMPTAGTGLPDPTLRLTRVQRALAALLVLLIIGLVVENWVVASHHRSYSETFAHTETDTANTFYTISETLTYINEAQRYLLGSASRRDVQLKRSLLAQRLQVVAQNGKTAGDSITPEFRAALGALDETIRQMPPGILPAGERELWAAIVLPRSGELSRASRHYADSAISGLHSEELAASKALLRSRLLELLLLIATFLVAAVLLAWVAVDVRRRYQSARAALETERNALQKSEAQNRALADQLSAEMSSAADYVRSILPDEMHGPVAITSRYLPAMQLGGDGFHYRWLDDDHLKVFLIDVSGHGIRPALLSASVNNLIRSGSLPRSTLLNPGSVLYKLNKLFQMDEQGGTYFTMWYGVYQASTRILRYASAGHPPALAFHRDGETTSVTSLSTRSVPIGMFGNTVFTSAAYTVPRGGQLLIYSDGAFELENDTDERQLLSHEDFIKLYAALAARPHWSLDTLVNELKALSSRDDFADDCALVLMTFP